MEKNPRDIFVSNVHHLFDTINSLQETVEKAENAVKEVHNVLVTLVESCGGEVRFNKDILETIPDGTKLNMDSDGDVFILKIVKPAPALKLVPKEEQ